MFVVVHIHVVTMAALLLVASLLQCTNNSNCSFRHQIVPADAKGKNV